MLKRLAILAVLALGVYSAWPQIPRDRGKQEGPAQKETNGPKPTQPLSPAIQVQAASAKHEDGPKEKRPSYPWKELLAPANIPNWVLCLVGGFAGWAAYKTLRAIKRQSDLMKRQIDLQSVAMSQWVNIEPIKTVTPPAFQNPIEVVLEFQVLNKTDYLLTVKKIEAEVFYGGKARIFKVSGSDPVPPEKSSADGGLPFFLTLFANRSTWSDIGVMFFVGGEVTYLDCMDIERTQEFRDMFHGYEDGRLVRKKSSGQVPEITDYKTENEETKTSDSERSWSSWVVGKLKRAPKPN
jgi:hypothetical protein